MALLALVLVSCGGSGSKSEQTPTPAANVAQPTATVAMPQTSAASPQAALGTPAVPGAILIPTTISTPAVVAGASPAPSTTGAIPSTPVPPAATEGTPATSTGGLPVGDGTGSVPAGTPVATPASGTPVAAPVTVTSCTPETVPPFRGSTTSYVVREDLNFRTGPGSDCDLISETPLAVGTALTVTGGPVVREGEPGIEWVQVEVDGQAGWVAAEFIAPAG